MGNQREQNQTQGVPATTNNTGIDVNKIIRAEKEDQLVWVPDIMGKFIVSLAYEEIRDKGPKVT